MAPWTFPFDFRIVYRHGRKHQEPDAVSLLQRDNEIHFPADDDETSTYADANVLAVRTRSAREDANGTAIDTNQAHGETPDDDLHYPLDEEDIELDAIDLYQAAS